MTPAPSTNGVKTNGVAKETTTITTVNGDKPHAIDEEMVPAINGVKNHPIAPTPTINGAKEMPTPSITCAKEANFNIATVAMMTEV